MITAKPGESRPLPGVGPANGNEHKGPRGLPWTEHIHRTQRKEEGGVRNNTHFCLEQLTGQLW